MKGFFLKARTFVASFLILSLISSNTIHAAVNLKDVSKSYWAYDQIMWVAEKGYMVGDTSGYFKPKDAVNKFEASKVLARVLGFKSNKLTETEASYIQKVYNKNKGLLDLYDNNFQKWDKNTDREIAFLIEKEVIANTDLDQFVIKYVDGKEAIKYLTKEEAAFFLTKLIGENETALTSKYDFVFSDDGAITNKYKPYVYFLKEKGVFTADKNKMFGPKDTVTREVFATMLFKTLSSTENYVDLGDDKLPLGEVDLNSNNSSSNVVSIFSLEGTIDKYYPTLDALQIISSDGKKNIYKLGTVNTIQIDGFIKTIGDLKVGMHAVVVVNNNEIVDVKANSSDSNSNTGTDTNTNETSVNPNTGANNSANTNTNTDTNSGTTQNTNSQTSSTSTDEFQNGKFNGTISSISIADKVLGFDLNLTDGSIRTKKIPLSSNVSIKRSGKIESFDNIVLNDKVSIEVSNGMIISLELTKNSLQVIATLTDKKVNSFGVPVLVLKDKDSNVFEFSVDQESVITRKGTGNINWDNLRIGDTCEVTSSLNKVKDLYAYGVKSTIEGEVTNIYMSNSFNTITIKTESGENEYRVLSTFTDLNYVKVGNIVKLNLDSLEVESVTVSNKTPAKQVSFAGAIKSVSNQKILVEDGKNIYELYISGSTVYFDTRQGKYVGSNQLTVGRKIYIVLEDNSNSLVKTITFLN